MSFKGFDTISPINEDWIYRIDAADIFEPPVVNEKYWSIPYLSCTNKLTILK